MPDSDSDNQSNGGGPRGTPQDWDRQIFVDFKDELLNSLKQPLAEVERWSLFSMVFAALSALTVLGGCIIAIIVTAGWVPGTWTDPLVNMSIVSNVAAVLTTSFNVFWNHRFNVACKELAARRDQIDQLTSKLFRRLFGESGEPSVVTYAHKDAIAGRFIKVDRENWREESFQGDATKVFRFKYNRREGTRFFLEDDSKPRRYGEVEIDLEFKRVLWINLRTNEIKELYRVVDTD